MADWTQFPIAGQAQQSSAQGVVAPSASPDTQEAGWTNFPVVAAPGLPSAPTADMSPAQGDVLGRDEAGMREAAMRAMTFGLSDKVGALGAATGDYLGQAIDEARGKEGDHYSFGDFYDQAVKDARSREEDYVSKHPILARLGYALGAAGSVAPFSAVAPAATLGGKIAQGAAIGAPIGGVSAYGASDNTGLPLARDIAYGAAVGGITGGALPVATEIASGPLEFAARKLGVSSPETQAADRVSAAIAKDQAAGGPGPAEIQTALGTAGNKPVSIADVSGANVKALGGNVARAPGPGREAVEQFLNQRDAEAGVRMAQDVNSLLANGGTAFDTAQGLIAQRAKEAAPLYEQAYAANQSISSPEIDKVLATPAGQRALTNARQLMANDMTLMGKPDPQLTAAAREAAQLGLMEPHGSGTGVAAGLKLQTLDYVKRSLDDMINSAQRAGENNNARVMIGLKGKLVGALDSADETGAYAQARSIFAGHSSSLDALQEGAKIFNKEPSLIANEISNLSPSEQEFYRLGAADALKTQIARTSSGGNEARAVIGNAYKQAQLRPIFPDQDTFDDFINSAKTESRMFSTKLGTIGGSDTARRVAEDTGGMGEGVVEPLARAGMAFATGEPTLGAANLGLAGRGALRLMQQPSLEANAQIAKLLFSSDPADNRAALAMILSRRGRPAVGQAIAAPLQSVPGQIWGSVASPNRDAAR